MAETETIKSLALNLLAKRAPQSAPTEKCPTLVLGLGHLDECPAHSYPAHFWGSHRDAYGWRVNALIEFIGRLDYPVGVVPWLEAAAPYLYDRLTRALPDRISQAWDAKAPFDEFDALCCELEVVHERAVALYRQSVLTAKLGRG